jgi:hypothetical protein
MEERVSTLMAATTVLVLRVGLESTVKWILMNVYQKQILVKMEGNASTWMVVTTAHALKGGMVQTARMM